MIKDYVALDLETTGVNPAGDRIIEIGMIKVIEGRVTDKYSTLINPGFKIPERVQDLTHITNEDVKGKPRIEDVIGEVIAFIGDYPIMGHNVIFDYSFLKKAAVNNGYELVCNGIDTLKMARRIYPELEHKNLDYLCSYLGIDPGNSHRALDDAMSSSSIYWKMYEKKPDDSGFEFTNTLVYSVKKDSPITAAQKKYVNALIKKHNIELEIPVEEMTKSMASRTIDKIISEYGK